LNDAADTTAKPMLLFFFDGRDGHARRVEGFLAQTLQRRHNHETFRIKRIDVNARPDLVERFLIMETPAICVVDNRRVAARTTSRLRGVADIHQILAPWLR
jgi:hypothetical protein